MPAPCGEPACGAVLLDTAVLACDSSLIMTNGFHPKKKSAFRRAKKGRYIASLQAAADETPATVEHQHKEVKKSAKKKSTKSSAKKSKKKH